MHKPLKFSIWFSIVITAVFVVAWLWIREFSEPGPYDLESVGVVRNGNRSNLTLDETAGWRIFRKEEYKFEVKYPQNWGFLDNGWGQGGYGVGFGPVTNNPNGVAPAVFIGGSTFYQIGEDKYFINKQDIQDSVNDFKRKVSNFKKEDVVINGISAVKVGGLENTNPNFLGKKKVGIFLIKEEFNPENNILYSFSYSECTYRKDCFDFEKTFDQIISTLKFIK